MPTLAGWACTTLDPRQGPSAWISENLQGITTPGGPQRDSSSHAWAGVRTSPEGNPGFTDWCNAWQHITYTKRSPFQYFLTYLSHVRFTTIYICSYWNIHAVLSTTYLSSYTLCIPVHGLDSKEFKNLQSPIRCDTITRAKWSLQPPTHSRGFSTGRPNPRSKGQYAHTEEHSQRYWDT